MTPLIVRRVRPVSAMAAGLFVAAVGFGMLTLADGLAALAVLVAGSVVLSLGLAPVFTSVTDLVLRTAPPQRAGAASAMSETSTEFGGALGSAILGVVGAAVYRSQVVVPAGVAPEAAAASRDTLGAAAAAAGRLPDELGAALLGPARQAFTEGLHAVAGLSAVIAVVLAVVLLRGTRGTGQTQLPKRRPRTPLPSSTTGSTRRPNNPWGGADMPTRSDRRGQDRLDRQAAPPINAARTDSRYASRWAPTGTAAGAVRASWAWPR